MPNDNGIKPNAPYSSYRRNQSTGTPPTQENGANSPPSPANRLNPNVPANLFGGMLGNAVEKFRGPKPDEQF